MFPNIQLQKQHFLRQGWPTSTHWRATQFVRTRPRATFVRTYIEGGTKLTRTPAFTNASFIFFFCYLLKLPYYALQTYHVTVAKLYYWIILVEDIPLCLSIILKWNKIYTSSNTTMLYFINLKFFYYYYYVRTFIDILPENFLELFCKISCYVCKFVTVYEIHDFFIICILINDDYRIPFIWFWN